MNIDEYNEVELEDIDRIRDFLRNIASKDSEMILVSQGKMVGAILTAEQYTWFLDQLDAAQDTSFIDERISDRDGSQNLEDFKKELGS